MNSIEIINKTLVESSQKLGLEVGIVSSINDEHYKVIASVINGHITTPDDEYAIRAGSEFILTETYCSDVIHQNRTLAYQDVENISSMQKHPCYVNNLLRSYIGSPLHVNGELFGTLNFSALKPRANDFATDEINYMEFQAQAVSGLLEQYI